MGVAMLDAFVAGFLTCIGLALAVWGVARGVAFWRDVMVAVGLSLQHDNAIRGLQRRVEVLEEQVKRGKGR